MKKRVVVIGSGFGGLAAAALLAKDGYDVTILEKNEQVGGRAGWLEKKGFGFDMGPSWYLMPDVFERYFSLLGKKPSELYKLHRLESVYRIFFADKTHVDISPHLEENIALFESIEPGAGEAFRRYLKESEEKYRISIDTVLYKNMDAIFDFFSWELLKKGRQLGALESMESYVKKFFTSEKLQQIILYTLVFLGGSPSNTPAIYSLMSHVDFNLGVWYPEGGMNGVARALAKEAQNLGIKVVLNAPVKELIVENGFVKYVKTDKKQYPADIVVSGAEYQHTESLLPGSARQYSDAYWEKRTLAPSAFILYLGVKKKLPKIHHHTLLFGENWLKHFEEIFDQPAWPMTPSLYICNPNKTEKGLAPEGSENLFILVPTAAGLSETPQSREKYAQFIISYIEKNVGVSFASDIVVQEIFSLTEFEKRYNSPQGTALGLAHTLFQTAIFRPPNHHRKVKNLFFSGATTVPGIGVPMCLISAELVLERIRKWDQS